MTNKFYKELNEEIRNSNKFPKWVTFLTFCVIIALMIAGKMGAFDGW